MNSVTDQMREDWNARAREDAHYFVAFARRGQDEDEFFASAWHILQMLHRELKRGTPSPAESRRFLEIGCGPGRLMRPLSEHCGEIHGVDISNEMIARAKANLEGVSNAFPRLGTGSTLDFPDSHFDFVYSYAVFQHIPSKDIVYNYLRETVRVLKPGGLVRMQINGLARPNTPQTTWQGVWLDADEIRQFTKEQGIELLALEGLGTQYMWTTWRKAAPVAPKGRVSIRRVTNAYSSEPAVPVGGRFAAVSVWTEGLPETADLNTLSVRVAGKPATSTYIGAELYGLRQIDVNLPPGLPTGIAVVELADATHRVRLVPRPPLVPRIMSLSDGIDLLSTDRITSGMLKLSVEEFEPLSDFRAEIDGEPLEVVEALCVDPVAPRQEINCKVSNRLQEGEHSLTVWLGKRLVGTQTVTIA